MSPVTEPTLVARVTSSAPSAIAVIEVSGPRALDFVDRCWRPNRGTSELKTNRIRYGYSRSDSSSVGESIVVCKTGDQRVEIHCHGGRMASQQMIDRLVACGAVNALSLHPFYQSTEDEIVREAIEDLTKANSLKTTSILLGQMRGALSREFAEILNASQCGDRNTAMERLRRLRSRYEVGRHLIEPWRVVLAGPPNVGKSSLLNRLLGYGRAIVHEQAGTTRDVIAEQTSFDGWPVELIDGAGIRNLEEANDAIESIGIEQTLARVAVADCVLLLVEHNVGWTDTHSQILEACSSPLIVVLTKMDLVVDSAPPSIGIDDRHRFESAVETSCSDGTGIEKLMQTISQTLVRSPSRADEPIPFRHRHLKWIDDMLSKLNR